MTSTHFEIKLPQFEGPFDLLLFFIERDELDIHDIPISKITNDFLDYIHTFQTINVDLASEFILVAATLMKIKARMLLPRKELDEEGKEIDPREELVKRLIEYKKYKEASAEMQHFEAERLLKEKRGNLYRELAKIAQNTTAADELHNLDLYKLLTVFEKVMQKFNQHQLTALHTVIPFPYTIENQKEHVLSLLKTHKKISFETLLLSCKDKFQVVFSFLSILEMLQQQVLEIKIGLGYNNFWLQAM